MSSIMFLNKRGDGVLRGQLGAKTTHGAIWAEIREMSASAGVHSSTGAMKDIFEGKKDDLEEYIKAFQCLPHQKGIFVLVEGEVAGWDMLSRESAFEVIFPKLVKSYTLDVLLEKGEKKISKEERVGRMSGYKRRRVYRV